MRILLFLLLFCGSFSSLYAEALKVSVSVPPIKSIVEKIGQERVSAVSVVPTGASPHTYEPKGKQSVELCQTELFFGVGESFEKRLSTLLAVANPEVAIIDLRNCIEPIASTCLCHTQDVDPHIWLSPKQLRKISGCVFETLCTKDPEGEEFYQKNYLSLLAEIEKLEEEANHKFNSTFCKTFITGHAAFGYLCRDYALTQLSLEKHGRPPTPKTLLALIDQAKAENVSIVLAQPQYNPKGAVQIAGELHAKVEYIDPYKEDVLANLYELICALCPTIE